MGPVLEDILELEWYRDPRGHATEAQLDRFVKEDIKRFHLARNSLRERYGKADAQQSIRSMYGIINDGESFLLGLGYAFQSSLCTVTTTLESRHKAAC